MNDIKTPPMTGNAIIETFKNNFFEKYTEENGAIKALQFWPATLIEETYKKAAGEIGGANEIQALKAFYVEMVHFLRMSTYMEFDPREDDFILGLLEGREPA